VLITNGGYGTIQQALAHGVPIVVAGATEDKPEVAARVAWSGTGIRIASGRPRPQDVTEAASRALRDPRYRERARAIAREMHDHDAARQPPAYSNGSCSPASPSTRSLVLTGRAQPRRRTGPGEPETSRETSER
jgi:UDP-glucoronosyl and UDP-glucosyl transferase